MLKPLLCGLLLLAPAPLLAHHDEAPQLVKIRFTPPKEREEAFLGVNWRIFSLGLDEQKRFKITVAVKF